MLDCRCSRNRRYRGRSDAAPNLQLDPLLGLCRRLDPSNGRRRVARSRFGNARDPHWSRSFLDFLSARRYGRRRCEVDGRFWRGPGSQTASGSRLVDGRVWRSDGGGSDRSQSASKILDRKAAGFCNRNRGIGLNARHSARVHSVCSSHSGRSVAESGSKDMRAILHSGSW